MEQAPAARPETEHAVIVAEADGGGLFEPEHAMLTGGDLSDPAVERLLHVPRDARQAISSRLLVSAPLNRL